MTSSVSAAFDIVLNPAATYCELALSQVDVSLPVCGCRRVPKNHKCPRWQMDFLLLLRATCNQLGRAGRLIGAVGQHSGPLAVTELILGLVPGIQGSCNPRLSAWRLSCPRGWVEPSPAAG